jgi:caffeoyl-CoA O-methyltransferase
VKNRPKPYRVITDSDVERYAEEHSTPESEITTKLIQNSDEELAYIDMLSGPLVGNLLQFLVQISGAKNCLEIGTFTGYSAIKMAEVLPVDGRIDTIEMNTRYQDIAQKNFLMSGYEKKIHLIKANAREEITKLNTLYDLIYLDADKLYYQHYYEYCIPILKCGGILVADNVLWNAQVLAPKDFKSKALDAFNKQLKEDNRVNQLLLPLRDGCTIVRKK